MYTDGQWFDRPKLGSVFLVATLFFELDNGRLPENARGLFQELGKDPYIRFTSGSFAPNVL